MPRSLFWIQRITFIGSAFQFTLNLIVRSTVGFLTGQARSNLGTQVELEAKNKDFGAVSQRNLTKVKFRHWRGLIAFGLPKQSRQAFSAHLLILSCL